MQAAEGLPEGDDDVRVWAVELDDGRRVPLKALFRRATDLSDFTSQRAQRSSGTVMAPPPLRNSSVGGDVTGRIATSVVGLTSAGMA